MPVVESNIYALWGAKQSAKGTPAVASAKRFRMVGGDVQTARDDGSENFSDLDRFGDAADFVNTLVGQGTPVIQAQSNELAHILYWFFGTEVFTAKSAGVSPPKFVYEPGANIGFWTTWWKRVGSSQVHREKFNDTKITGIRIEGSTANKVVKINPTLLSLDPGEIFTSDPATALGVSDPFLYTEGQGAFTLDGVIFRGHSQFAVVVNDASTAYYGDSAVPMDVTPGNAAVTLESITFLLDDIAYARYCALVYGTPTPTAGAKPITTIPAAGSWQCLLSRSTLDTKESLKIEVPKVRWAPDVAIAPNPDGGPVEVALTGGMRKMTTTPKSIRITVETGAGDNTAHTT